MKKGKIIAIEGAPRSGKSFLCQKLSEKYGYKYFLEGLNDTFPKWVEDSIKNNTDNLRRIAWFRNTQVNNFLKALKLADTETVLVDTFWADNMIYFDLLLNGHDLEVAIEQGKLDRKILPFPDKVIYLKNSEEQTKKFLVYGGREFDQSEVYDMHIKPLMKKYDELLEIVPKEVPMLILDRTNMDFEKEEDLLKIWQFIEG